MRLWALFGLLAMFIGSALTAHAYRPVFKDVAGATRTYTTTSTVTGASQLGTISIPINATTTMTAVEKVLAAQNGTASVSYQITGGKMSMKVTMPGEEDAETIEQPITPFGMTFNRSSLGLVTNLKMTGGVPQLFGGPIDQALSRLDDAGTGLAFPAKDLQIGDTWTGREQMVLPDGNKIDMAVKYTLAGVQRGANGNVLQIKSDITISAPKMTMTLNLLGQAFTIPLSFTLAGTEVTLFDEAAGVATRSDYRYTGEMNMGTPDGGSAKTPLTMVGSTVLAR